MSEDYNWKRFWYREEDKFSLINDNGFLKDPGNDWGGYLSEKLVSLESLLENPNNKCLILLGEPGMGKTYAFNSIKKRMEPEGRKALFFRLEGFGDEDRLERKIFENETLISWKKGKGDLHLFLDSLDECHLQVNTLYSVLKDNLERCDSKRLFLRIFCRTADWKDSFKKNLKEKWKEDFFAVYELAPLRECDVLEAAQKFGLNHEKFIGEIHSKNAGLLAARPVTLKFLLNTYRNSSLPDNQEELYTKGCELLCEETNPLRREAGRIGKFSAGQKMAVAARLAAVSVFTNHLGIWTTVDMGDVPEDDFLINEVCGSKEKSNGKKFDVSEEIVRETLSTGLFNSIGQNRKAFTHKTFTEFLAAYYIHKSGASLAQILDLICWPEDSGRKVVPIFYETTAWLAGMNKDIFKHIMESDPAVLLRSDVARADNKTREKLVENLLDHFENNKLMETHYEFHNGYKKLVHPGLAKQLRLYIKDSDKSIKARKVAIEIARACGLHELFDDLTEIIFANETPTDMRIVATRAVKDIASENSSLYLDKFKSFAFGEGADDPYNELKGYALSILWPDHLTAEELFNALTLPKKNVLGSYEFFISTILDMHQWGDDIEHALRWVLKQKMSSPFQNLRDSILTQASNTLDSPGILELFIEALGLLFFPKIRIVNISKIDGSLFNDLTKRRRFIEASLPLLSKDMSKEDPFFSETLQILREEDFSWMLERLHNESTEEAQKVWVSFIRGIVRSHENTDQWNAIITTCGKNETLLREFGLDQVKLDSNWARHLQEKYLRGKEREEKEQKKIETKIKSIKKIGDILDSFEQGDLSSWLKIANLIAESGGYTGLCIGEILESDLTKFKMWETLDADTKQRILVVASQYVVEQPPETEKYLGTNKFYYPAYTSYKALVLLSKEDIVLFENLPTKIWDKWAPVILAYPTGTIDENDDIHRRLVEKAYHAAPQKIRDTFSFLIDKANSGECSFWGLNKLRRCWDDKLTELLVEKLKNENLKPRMFKEILQQSLELESQKAEAYARSLLALPLASEEHKVKNAVTAAVSLMEYAGDVGWPIIWPLLEKNIEFGKKVISECAHNSIGKKKVEEKLGENQLAALFMWLETQFPGKEELSSVFKEITPEDSVKMWKSSLLNNLSERGTSSSCAALERIVKKYPDIDYLERYLYKAQYNTRKANWKPARIADILNLDKNLDSRLISDDNGLLDLVVDSLQNLEQKLQGETPAAEDLWDKSANNWYPVEEERFSNYLKRHLDDELIKKGIIINREVQIHRGERTDLRIDAFSKDSNEDAFKKLSVIIEVKGCWHSEIKKAMEDQLVGQYLRDNSCRNGIYLVGWFGCDKCSKSSCNRTFGKKSKKEAQDYFDQQAAELSPKGYNLRAVVLDTSLQR